MTALPDTAAISAALEYAARGWPVFAMNAGKKPLTRHGSRDATTDAAQIRNWRWPGLQVAVLTGETSGIVALDVDIKNGVDGRDTIEIEFGIAMHPESPTAHSPSGGFHVLFAWPEHFVKTGPIGPGVEVKADNGWITLPPGPGRYWDPHLNLDTVPLAPMPSWMLAPEPTAAPIPTSPRPIGRLSRYAEKALDSAVKRILEAGAGAQETTLNSETFAIGRLAGGGVIPPSLALDSLLWAARRIPSFDKHRPWRAADLERKVKSTFADGLREPRTVPDVRG